MATIVAAMTTTAIFSVILSSFTSQAKADKRDAAALMMKSAQETLKSYVSAVPADGNYVPNGGRWTADSTGVWALSDGIHPITSLLNGTELQGGTFSYTVGSFNCGFGFGAINETACKSVTFTLTYPDN